VYSPQAGDNLWKTHSPPADEAGSRLIPCLRFITPEIRPAMKGTLGSTDRALLRGGVRKVALQAEFPREIRIFGGEPRENALVGQDFPPAPGGFVKGGRLSKASLGQSERAAGGVRRERWFSTRPLPRFCDRRCPGQTDRGSPAPLTSDREGAAPDRPKAVKAPDLEKTRLEPPFQTRRLHPTNATRATSGRSAGLNWSEVVLADRARLQRAEGK
jgi:hypothetical protein